jgi:transcriptional regulator with GAF, ATPase, and Fis domain
MGAMKLDKNAFFQQVTAHISSSLDLQTAMERCYGYLQSIINCESMFLVLIEPELSAVRLLHVVGKYDHLRQNTLIPLSLEQRLYVKEHVEVLIEGKAIISDELPDNPLSETMGRLLGPENSLPAAVLELYLSIENTKLAILSLVSSHENTFTEEDAELLGSVKAPFAIAVANALHVQELTRLKNMLAEENQFLRSELNSYTGDDVVGANFGLRHIMDMAHQVATLKSPVLLLGETGVGKDVIANAIHHYSQRQDGPFIRVNCGAIPDSLIDSELFGHEKGAFTGAFHQKRGRFERADGGTIFLDEIAELPMQAQTRLLRVLQSNEIERVGGSESIPLDIRIITATNCNLEQRIKEGRFREDLWFRLNVFPIHIPPLRQRSGDIPALIHHFVEKKSREMKRPTIPELEVGSNDLLQSYDWPGNVRELENLVERALILHHAGPLSFRQVLHPAVPDQVVSTPTTTEVPIPLNETLVRHIKHALEYTRGKISGPDGAAALLEVNVSTLRNKMRKLGIPFGRKARGRLEGMAHDFE